MSWFVPLDTFTSNFVYCVLVCVLSISLGPTQEKKYNTYLTDADLIYLCGYVQL